MSRDIAVTETGVATETGVVTETGSARPHSTPHTPARGRRHLPVGSRERGAAPRRRQGRVSGLGNGPLATGQAWPERRSVGHNREHQGGRDRAGCASPAQRGPRCPRSGSCGVCRYSRPARPRCSAGPEEGARRPPLPARR